jgi:polyphenol oxidase
MKQFETKDIFIFWGAKGSSKLRVKDKDLSAAEATKLTDPSIKLLKQTHSNIGFNVGKEFNSFSKKGDFLITNQPSLSIGVKTADCTPIAFFDPQNKSIGVAHAGWQGTVKKISEATIKAMSLNFGSNPKDILIWIGPSAKTCCYEVSQDFYTNLKPEFIDSCLVQKDNKIYFNQQNYNKLVLLEAGILEAHINLDFNECTICNSNYGSYRREGANSPLQISYIMIK